MEEHATQVANLVLHKDAKAAIKSRTTWFSANLTTQAKLIANKNGHNVVIAKDVDEAMDVFFRERRPRSWLSDAAGSFGGILLGVGVPYFITEVSRSGGPRPVQTVAFAVLTVLGVLVTAVVAMLKR